ncbi:MAG: anthranilate phosphoribosyltransferase, partial [Candidatus Odinarchaeia archaeon]
MIKEAIQILVDRRDLTEKQAREAMRKILTGKVSPSQIASFITALRMKGETINEITEFAKVMRELSIKVPINVKGKVVDTCGTGGGLINTFNVSTAAAIIASGAGVRIVKHGNRSVTSKSGSADLLEKLGVEINLRTNDIVHCFNEVGLAFIFAPLFHPAMKYVMDVRKEIGIKTVFNILGPLTNPADVNTQLIGVYHKELVFPIVYALKNLGCDEGLVVHGLDGLDEISTIGKTLVGWLKDSKITIFEIKPREFGVKTTTPERLTIKNSNESAEVVFKILHGVLPRGDPARDFAVVNSAAAIMLGGKADSFLEGVELANESINSGRAYLKLKSLVKC